MKNIPTQGGIDGFNIIPETLQEVTPWVRNYRNPPNPINIPYNWYLEVHHVLSMLNDQVDGLNSCGIRLNGALKQNDPDQVMHFVVNNVVFNPGTQEYLDVLTNGKVFEYTKTCPNICGIMDQTKSFEPSSNYAKPLPFSWLIRKEKLLQIIDGDKINPSFIKVIRGKDLNENLIIHLILTDGETNHNEIGDRIENAGEPVAGVSPLNNLYK